MSIYVGYFVFVFIYSFWNILHVIIFPPFPQKVEQLCKETQLIGKANEGEAKEQAKGSSKFRHQKGGRVDQF